MPNLFECIGGGGSAICLKEKSGTTIQIEDAIPNKILYDLQIKGESKQDGTPTLENPIEIDSVTNDVVYIVNNAYEYGVEVDFEAKTFTRLGNAIGKNGGTDFDNVKAFARRRCNLDDNGIVTAYYGDSSYKEDGSNGQVMVEQNKFYYKVVPLKLDAVTDGKGYLLRKAQYWISDVQLPGYKLHPLFIRDGKKHDKVYLSAYEGSTYDVSASAYNTTDAQTVDWKNDKLSSIAGAKPTSGLGQSGATRNGFRTIAAKRGSGWSQETVQAATATEILFLVEYATFNTQAAIGAGNVYKASGNGNESEITGATVSLGNKSGAVVNDNGIQIVSYRGEENPWGNIWKWVDGLNRHITNGENIVYIADHGFTDDTGAAPYENAGISPSTKDGYVSAFCYSEEFDWLFIAGETSGDSNLPVGDYFWNYQTNAWTVARLGAFWGNSSGAGGFSWYLTYVSGTRNRDISGRLVYVPTEENYNGTRQEAELTDISLNGINGKADLLNMKSGKITRHFGYIESYNAEDLPNDNWISTTGQLSTGAKVVYELETPTEEDIPSNVLSALQGLKLYSGTNICTNSENAEMSIKYEV